MPFFYICKKICLKKIEKKKIINATATIFFLLLNWIITGRIQNVHIIGISAIAIYLFPCKTKSKRIITISGLIFALALIFLSWGFLLDPDSRKTVLFGPNTDAILAIGMMLPILSSQKKWKQILFLVLCFLVVLSTKSRAACIFLIPVLMLFLPFSKKFLFKKISKNAKKFAAVAVYVFALLAGFAMHTNIQKIYENSDTEKENRWSFLSYASDLDRQEAFKSAEQNFLKNLISIIFGTNISREKTGASNVIHSQQWDLLFSGGLINFFLISKILTIYIFLPKNYFNIILIFCFYLAAIFSTTIFSFPFLYLFAYFCAKNEKKY